MVEPSLDHERQMFLPPECEVLRAQLASSTG